MNVAVVIPSLAPEEKLVEIIEDLIARGFGRIYLVNDGSGDAFDDIFTRVEEFSECRVLRHLRNMGKGAALKTAFRQYIEDSEGLAGVVTMDADGQHSVNDVVAIAKELSESNALVLGVRDFDKDNVPAKSAIGNKLTRRAIKTVSGLAISDTQTGLRGIPSTFVEALITVAGDRYEFETVMLLETRKYNVSIKELPIETLYFDDNAASHFRPLADGVKVYQPIVKYGLITFRPVIKFAAIGITSFVLEYLLFILLVALFQSMLPEFRFLYATLIPRVCSAVFNFSMNKIYVFSQRRWSTASALKYVALCVAIASASYAGVYILSGVHTMPSAVSKILVDSLLFFVSYHVQKHWVFPSREPKQP